MTMLNVQTRSGKPEYHTHPIKRLQAKIMHDRLDRRAVDEAINVLAG
jgi:hypothetical protein